MARWTLALATEAAARVRTPRRRVAIKGVNAIHKASSNHLTMTVQGMNACSVCGSNGESFLPQLLGQHGIFVDDRAFNLLPRQIERP
jgi:hypothetical protein